ncbi:MAG: tetratricopeptide repeat protein [Gemmatimonadaceae bacterium]
MTKTGAAARAQFTPDDDESLVEFFVRYQRPIVIGVLAVSLGLGGWWMAKRSSEIRETKAGEALLAGESAYSMGNAPLAQVEFDKVMTRYAGTSAGAQAALLSAQIYFEDGKLDEGIARLETALVKAPRHLRAGVIGLLGSGKAAAGKPAEAAAEFERAAAVAQFRQEREQFQMEAARLYALAGNISAARALYEAIAATEDSGHAGEARLRLGELTSRT